MKIETVQTEDGWELRIVIKVKSWPDIIAEFRQLQKLFKTDSQES